MNAFLGEARERRKPLERDVLLTIAGAVRGAVIRLIAQAVL